MELYNIKNIPQYGPKELSTTNNNRGILKFDFAVLDSDENISYFIEYDGEQHFIDKFYGDENLEYRKERDGMKNRFCYKNGIPLIRIPYTVKMSIKIEDLLLSTTEFIFTTEENYIEKTK